MSEPKVLTNASLIYAGSLKPEVSVGKVRKPAQGFLILKRSEAERGRVGQGISYARFSWTVTGDQFAIKNQGSPIGS